MKVKKFVFLSFFRKNRGSIFLWCQKNIKKITKVTRGL